MQLSHFVRCPEFPLFILPDLRQCAVGVVGEAVEGTVSGVNDPDRQPISPELLGRDGRLEPEHRGQRLAAGTGTLAERTAAVSRGRLACRPETARAGLELRRAAAIGAPDIEGPNAMEVNHG